MTNKFNAHFADKRLLSCSATLDTPSSSLSLSRNGPERPLHFQPPIRQYQWHPPALH